MAFVRAIDQKFLETLLNDNVITQTIYQAWPKPHEEDHLNNLLLANGDTIDHNKWISFLLKSGRAYRYNSPKIEPAIYSELLSPDLHPDNRKFERLIRYYLDTPFYPLNIFKDSIWVGVFRLDTIKESELMESFPGFKHVFFCAITPKEAHHLALDITHFAKREFKLPIRIQTEI